MMLDNTKLKNRTIGREMPRSILIGYLPPPRIGPSVAFESLVHLYEEMGLPFVVVDIGSRNAQRKVGRFEWRRVVEVFRAIGHYLKHITVPNQVVYLTVAFSLVGFCRDFFVIWTAKLRHHRIVLHFRGGGYRVFVSAQSFLMRQVIIQTLRQADCLIVLGNNLKEVLKRLLLGSQQITIIHNTVSSDIPVRAEPKIRFGEAPMRVLYLSNMIEAKGYWDLLRAIQLLREKGRNIFADFAGTFMEGMGEKEYPDAITAKKAFLETLDTPVLAGAVRYYGDVSGSQKAMLLQKADVFVLPSYLTEGQPIALIEAVANALPIICTRIPNMEEIVNEGENGFTVPVKSPVEIANRLDRLYSSAELYNRMSAASIHVFHQSFARKVVQQQLLTAILGREVVPDAPFFA